MTLSAKKYYNEASTITTNLSAYLHRAYNSITLSIFSPYYQDQAKSHIQVNSQLLFEDKKKLNNFNKVELD